MRFVLLAISFFAAFLPISGQSVQAIYDTERAFGQAVAAKGFNPAFREVLADDAIIFRPEAVNGPEFFRTRDEKSAGTLRRTVTRADISTNGMLGYTTGEWTLTRREKNIQIQKIGQYATVWQRQPNGKYKAILDIEVSHEPLEKKKKRYVALTPYPKDKNIRGWSAADATMNFLKMSMTKKGLGGAYDKFAGDDVRLLREGVPPIDGRGDAEEEMERYKAIDFPTRVSQFEASDMAYSWNACSYSDSDEGMEKGNCLHIWKLRDQKWRIVLGVFARVANDTIPVLKEAKRKK